MNCHVVNQCCRQALTAVCDSLDTYRVDDIIPEPNPRIGRRCCPERDLEGEQQWKEFQHRWTVRHTGGNVLDWWDQSSLAHEVIKPGPGNRYPRCGDLVKVTYVIKLLDGTGVDWSRQPFQFRVGDPTVLSGLNQGVQLMRGGEQAKLYLPSHLGYGWWGITHTPGMSHVPENAELVITVTLLEIRRRV